MDEKGEASTTTMIVLLLTVKAASPLQRPPQLSAKAAAAQPIRD